MQFGWKKLQFWLISFTEARTSTHTLANWCRIECPEKDRIQFDMYAIVDHLFHFDRHCTANCRMNWNRPNANNKMKKNKIGRNSMYWLHKRMHANDFLLVPLSYIRWVPGVKLDTKNPQRKKEKEVYNKNEINIAPEHENSQRCVTDRNPLNLCNPICSFQMIQQKVTASAVGGCTQFMGKLFLTFKKKLYL